MITNDARCTREIDARIAMAKAAFNRNETLFTSKLDLQLELRNKLVLIQQLTVLPISVTILWRTDLLLSDDSVNSDRCEVTPTKYTHAILEQWGYATRF
jgi:hypothetical protein